SAQATASRRRPQASSVAHAATIAVPRTAISPRSARKLRRCGLSASSDLDSVPSRGRALPLQQQQIASRPVPANEARDQICHLAASGAGAVPRGSRGMMASHLLLLLIPLSLVLRYLT